MSRNYLGIFRLIIAMRELRRKTEIFGLTKMSLICLGVVLIASKVYGEYYYVANCSSLLPGQYLCNELNIDPQNQQLKGCTKDGHARIPCTSAPGIICRETNNGTFDREVPCRFVYCLFNILPFLSDLSTIHTLSFDSLKLICTVKL